MEGKPKCKKCGRVLKSPASIARGMGPKCAGVSMARGKRVEVRMKQSSGRAYGSVGTGGQQIPLFSGEMPTKQMSKREQYRRRREERRRMFEMREAFQCGLLLPQRKPLVYVPLNDGNWKETPSGRVISHERLQEYLRRYRFI
ncbi:MAG: hypothetical protein HY022_08450 [Chloroflexi bacterium]|nr:hypothetical protein [Chloroflexota bacterium]